jgi:hypothetical protein
VTQPIGGAFNPDFSPVSTPHPPTASAFLFLYILYLGSCRLPSANSLHCLKARLACVFLWVACSNSGLCVDLSFRTSLDQFHLTRREFFLLRLLEFFEAITRIKEQRSRRRAPLSVSVATTVTLLCSPCVGGQLCLTSGLPPRRPLSRMAGCKDSFYHKTSVHCLRQDC